MEKTVGRLQAAVLGERHKSENWRASTLWIVRLAFGFQGFYFTGTRIYVLAMMASWHVLTDTQATVLAILGLPAYLKMFPGLLSDRVPLGRWGRRRPYIFLGGLLYIPSYLLLIRVQEFGAAWIAAIFLLLFAWLLADTNLDALIVDITPQERSGQVQGAVQSSQHAGAILGTLLIPLLGPRIGWAPVLVMLACGALVQSGSALFIREVAVSGAALEDALPLKWVLRQALSRKVVLLGLFFTLFFSTSQATGNLLSIYMLSELTWSGSPETMRTFALVGSLSAAALVSGAFLTGRLPSRWFTSFTLYLGALVAIWALTLPWLLVNRAPEDLFLVYLANISVGVGRGIGYVLVLTMAMRVCPRSIEGFTFALMTSALHFGSLVVGAKTASAFVDRLGGVVPALFTLFPYGLISLVFLAPLLRSLDHRPERI